MQWLAAVFFCLCLVSCRSQVGRGGSAFSRVDSAHFTVYSDLSVAEIERQTERMELLLASFLAHGWEVRGEIPLRVNVVMLANRAQIAPLLGDKADGYMYQPVLFEPWIVVPAPGRDDDLQIISHELSHYLAFQVMPHQPHWFAEGLASFFQTAKIRGKDFTLGNVPDYLLAAVVREELLEPEQLFDDRLDHVSVRFYGSAWLLVHYLMTERADEFANYQVELARGKSHAQAWSAAFPDLGNEALRLKLMDYLRSSEYAYFTFATPQVEVNTKSKALRRADEDALWAILWSTALTRDTAASEKVSEHLQRALALDPDQPQALALSASLDGDFIRALKTAKRLTTKQPDSWLAWLTLAFVIEQSELIDPVRPSAADRALALVPRQPFAVMLKAFELARDGDRTGALQRAQQAVRLQPSNEALLWSRAALLAELGDCLSLVDVTATIRQVGHTKLTAKQLAALAELGAQCNQKAAR